MAINSEYGASRAELDEADRQHQEYLDNGGREFPGWLAVVLAVGVLVLEVVVLTQKNF